MATFGNTATPSHGYFFDDVGNSQYGSIIGTSFPGGYITDFNIYISGDGSSVNVQYCIWGTGGSLLWNSAVHSIGSGSRSIGGQAWRTNGVSGSGSQPGLFLRDGTNVRFGIQVDGNVVWTYESSGSVSYDRSHSSPGSFSSDGTEGSGAFGTYVTYIPLSAPTVTSATPNVGTSGTSVAVVGTQFTYATDVSINGASASFTVNDDSHLTCTVPAGATAGTGTLVVTNDAGSASIAFTVGQVYDNSGAGVKSLVAIKYGNGTSVLPIGGAYISDGAGGVKRIW